MVKLKNKNNNKTTKKTSATLTSSPDHCPSRFDWGSFLSKELKK